MSVLYVVQVHGSINCQPGIHTFEFHAVTVKISMTEYRYLIKLKLSWFILTLQSLEGNKYGKSEALNDASEVQFLRASFLHPMYITDTIIAC